MATVLMRTSTRLCNHAVCLVPRIAGGCRHLKPGQTHRASDKSRTEQKDSREPICPLLFHFTVQTLQSEQTLLSALTERLFPRAFQNLVTLPFLLMHAAIIMTLFENNRTTSSSSWHLCCQHLLHLCQGVL